jgi:hypothetical protein
MGPQEGFSSPDRKTIAWRIVLVALVVGLFVASCIMIYMLGSTMFPGFHENQLFLLISFFGAAALISVVTVAVMTLRNPLLRTSTHQSHRWEKNELETAWKAFTISVAIAIFLVSCWMMWTMGSTNNILGMGNTQPFFVVPLIIVFGVTALVAALTIASIAIHSMNMSDEHEALGLPKGSVRALIALSLIVIFAITAIYMQSQLSPYYRNLGNGTITLIEPSKSQETFALQTLTTVSTLVVAIAAFYFGTKAVATAQKASSAEPQITRIIPKSPFELNTDEQSVLYPIIVETEPKEKEVTATVEKKEEGTIEEVKENEFKFTPSASLEHGTVVTLLFQITNNPKSKEKLEVKIKKTTIESAEPPEIVLSGQKEVAVIVKTNPENQDVLGTIDKPEKGTVEATQKPSEMLFKPAVSFGNADTVTLTFTPKKNSASKKQVKVTKKKTA